MKLLTSRSNPQVRQLLRLSNSSTERRARGLTILDGEKLLESWRQSGGVAECVLCSEAALRRPGLRQWLTAIPAKSHYVLSDALISRISQVVSPTGVLAIVPTPPVQPLPGELGDCILLEGIQDPGNLGSMLRSTVASGIKRVVLSPGSVFAWSPKVVRAAMGAHFYLSIYEGVDISMALDRVSGASIATVPREGKALTECDLRQATAWLFGNESAGLSESIADRASLKVSIPMPGPAESLNVAAAAAICLFEQVRQRAT